MILLSRWQNCLLMNYLERPRQCTLFYNFSKKDNCWLSFLSFVILEIDEIINILLYHLESIVFRKSPTTCKNSSFSSK
jgi:hypothetical protein